MSVWSRFTSWLSGWPESKESKKEIEQEYLFAEEEEMIKKNNKNIGKKPKKKKTRKQGNMQ
jgi:hypothetical protein|tara:strand:+ start:695 stop:877 length:183 start_codon:yes stop_codon:yes gene_type:complete